VSPPPAGRGIPAIAAALVALAPVGAARAQSADPTTPVVPPPAAPVVTPVESGAPPSESLADLVDAFDDKNRVPVNPALDILDANALNAVKPGSLKDLGTDLRALYKGGKIVPQIAVELSPYALAFGRRTTYDDYRRHAYVPILHRLSISLATTNDGEGETQATLGALGVRMRIYDRSDWRLDDEAVSCALGAVTLAKPPPAPGDAVVVPVEDETSKREARKVKECFEKARRRVGTWNAEQLAVGAALSSAFPGGKLEADIRDLTAWISWGHKLGRGGLLVLTGKYLFADTRRDADARLPARHSGSFAAELERRGDRFGILGSLGVGHRWSDDVVAMEWSGAWVAQIGGGVQLRVSDATWVELRASTQLVEGEDGTFISLANFKWNFEVKPSKGK